MNSSYIVVKGARVHNLRNVSVKIPKNKITVISGLSGSGKSSLAFDTIYAEGQRRYVESLSSYSKQFFGELGKPDVDLIEGLTPAISIDQKSAARSPRSTVATMSEIYDYIRLLFARVGKPHCPTCQLELQEVKREEKPATVHADEIEEGLDELDVSEGVEEESNQEVFTDRQKKNLPGMICPQCEQRYHRPSISLFSFNSPQGACDACQGLGKKMELEPKLIVPNPRLTLAEGAIRPWSRLGSQEKAAQVLLDQFAKISGASLDVPVGKMSKAELDILFYGSENGEFQGVIGYLGQKHRETNSDYVRSEIERYMIERICPKCEGRRLNQVALRVKIGDTNISDVVDMTVGEAKDFVGVLAEKIEPNKTEVAKPIIQDLIKRLGYLQRVGLYYLSLGRSSDTLSGGEAQRIRLATQLGSQLTGVLYVLDEPSIGLHPKELDQLIQAIRELKDNGNTVIIVEHDAQMIAAADYIIDFGPGAGIKGGKIVGKGNTQHFYEHASSLTAQYLRGEKEISTPKKRRVSKKKHITITGAAEHNLKNVDVAIPLENLICVTGVSGSGKTTLVNEILSKALAKHFFRAKAQPGKHKEIFGLEHINKVITVDQSPIGKTPRSNPATYTNVFAVIREVFAATLLAKQRKYGIGHFSFNVRGGRCETCRGEGQIRYEMHFMPDVYVGCSECGGTRYNTEVLDVTYKGKNISEVLDMTVNEAYRFFKGNPSVTRKLNILVEVGLGYVQLGQPANTLSGGEAQRIKLATELSRQDTGRTLYILDEPTTGLHFEDIKRLLGVLQMLVDKGNTVLIVEHNLDVAKNADWIIDMGPAGGDAGGKVVAEGTPEEIAANPNSETGKYLKEILGPKGAIIGSELFKQPKTA